MFSHKELEDYILSMPNARLDYPFGEEVAVYKVLVPHTSVSHMDAAQGSSEERAKSRDTTLSERKSVTDEAMRHKPASAGTAGAGGQGKAVRGDWKMFALIREGKTPIQLSLKCDPALAKTLRERYESVLPGYHLNKKHWNTILLTGQLSEQEIKDLITHSYNLASGINESELQAG